MSWILGIAFGARFGFSIFKDIHRQKEQQIEILLNFAKTCEVANQHFKKRLLALGIDESLLEEDLVRAFSGISALHFYPVLSEYVLMIMSEWLAIGAKLFAADNQKRWLKENSCCLPDSFVLKTPSFTNVIGSQALYAAMKTVMDKGLGEACWSVLLNQPSIVHWLGLDPAIHKIDTEIVTKEKKYTADETATDTIESIISAAPGIKKLIVSGRFNPLAVVAPAGTNEQVINAGEAELFDELLEGYLRCKLITTTRRVIFQTDKYSREVLFDDINACPQLPYVKNSFAFVLESGGGMKKFMKRDASPWLRILAKAIVNFPRTLIDTHVEEASIESVDAKQYLGKGTEPGKLRLTVLGVVFQGENGAFVGISYKDIRELNVYKNELDIKSSKGRDVTFSLRKPEEWKAKILDMLA